MEQQYTREKEQLEAQLLVKENEVVYLRMKIVEQEWTIDDLHYEKDKFKRKSEGHRNHIILLQKELKDSEAHIDEIANDLADADAEVNDLQSTIEDVENKIEKSERRSEARRKQTLLLRKKLKDSEAREDEVIRDLEDAYAKIKRLEGSVENFKAGVERLTSKSNKLIKNINVLKKQHQTNEEYLYEANDEIHRLTSLSDSHRSQINSLQKLVKKKNAIISRLEDELSENVNDYYY
ncbi:hypothetical protein H4R24_004441 [Coemansia sp. RSA 988]|nr:hypothetical protein H4R24_004441 [Coemansia sp. RSA 988]